MQCILISLNIKAPHTFQSLLFIFFNFISPHYAFPFIRTSRRELVNYSRDQAIRDLKIKLGNTCISLKYKECQFS